MTSEPTNADRAEWAEIGLRAFTDRVFHGEADRDLSDPDAFEQALGDFLCNLMHLADRQGVNFEQVLERGRCHYSAEVREEAEQRLEYLRGEIKAERISYGEIAELQALAEYIEPGDVELLQWAGVPEGGTT